MHEKNGRKTLFSLIVGMVLISVVLATSGYAAYVYVLNQDLTEGESATRNKSLDDNDSSSSDNDTGGVGRVTQNRTLDENMTVQVTEEPSIVNSSADIQARFEGLELGDDVLQGSVIATDSGESDDVEGILTVWAVRNGTTIGRRVKSVSGSNATFEIPQGDRADSVTASLESQQHDTVFLNKSIS